MDGQFVRLTCSGDIGMASVHHGPVSECVCVFVFKATIEQTQSTVRSYR